ncbi:hypothetical protein EW146_g138 [Bondarzewia mesenterica]|uniref:GIY-YIG domain-containing protein n=1 Tax=Bondarzewia mesenterica TaxID=1095465 RepID=A0A4S4MA33_9AGAM|nr:hypothetical protein EW146_g138 [Bondarzewia mesenterica]
MNHLAQVHESNSNSKQVSQGFIMATTNSRSSLANHRFPAFYACYLLKSVCVPTAIYIGSTPNPSRRIRQHNGEIAQGAHKTVRNRPWVMQMIVYGFPSRLTALQFEWAWQHHHKSRQLRDEEGKPLFSRSRKMPHLTKVVRTMLSCQPYNTWPLHVKLFTNDAIEAWDGTTKGRKGSVPLLPAGVRVEIELEGVDGNSGEVGSGRHEPIDVSDEQFTSAHLNKHNAILASGKLLNCACNLEHFVDSEHDGTNMIPRGGHCPTCRSYTLWGDVVKGCYRRHAVKALSEAEISDDEGEMFGSAREEEEEELTASSVLQSTGKKPAKKRRTRAASPASDVMDDDVPDFSLKDSSSQKFSRRSKEARLGETSKRSYHTKINAETVSSREESLYSNDINEDEGHDISFAPSHENITVHFLRTLQSDNSTEDYVNGNVLLKQGRLFAAIASRSDGWVPVKPKGDTARFLRTTGALFVWARPPPRIEVKPTLSGSNLKDWETPIADLDALETFTLDALDPFLSTNVDDLLRSSSRQAPTFPMRVPVVQHPEECASPEHPPKRIKPDNAAQSLCRIIPLPHYHSAPFIPHEVSALEADAKGPIVPTYSRVAPVPISPYTSSSIESLLSSSKSRVTWIIPVRGAPPWDGTTAAQIASTGMSRGCSPNDAEDYILWTHNSLGPISVSFHVAPSNASSSNRKHPSSVTPFLPPSESAALPLSISPDTHSSIVTRRRLLHTDHIKVHCDARGAMKLRTLFDAWSFKTEESGREEGGDTRVRKIRVLKFARLALVDCEVTGMLIS